MACVCFYYLALIASTAASSSVCPCKCASDLRTNGVSVGSTLPLLEHERSLYLQVR
ncbi:hypothetical protein PF010_g2117 [Phytophthora fragariae]|nr:hypothetical protein PF003_g25014 [Phytophthora fragariae]KAE9005556.1 hypothetical protein PR001_g17421 [Phytophthora rubi]KAE8947739.1 hypothetical protein PF009_g2683 [Phytophthora fragariae]KAE9027898.1 hypothetical protein PF011_g1823 [Phytophthora fragariae]KAE9135360.1 hypothetical protein PF010_g2117 [Phytophthora fragariae]